MAGEVVETHVGRRHTYAIRAMESRLNTRFAIYRDGLRWKGDYNSLARAIEVAQADD